MPRPLRLAFLGAIYHITSGENARVPIYLGDEDNHTFLRPLADGVEKFNWTCPAYCLVDNHYHLLIETPDANLQEGMRQLNDAYTQQFNRAPSRARHLFQGRFKGILVGKDSYLHELCRYIALNPVRAKMLEEPRQYSWSSYGARAGQKSALSTICARGSGTSTALESIKGTNVVGGASKNRSERSRCCAEKRSFASAKRGSQAQETPAE